jgi:hypothetical protein
VIGMYEATAAAVALASADLNVPVWQVMTPEQHDKFSREFGYWMRLQEDCYVTVIRDGRDVTVRILHTPTGTTAHYTSYGYFLRHGSRERAHEGALRILRRLLSENEAGNRVSGTSTSSGKILQDQPPA